MRIEKMCKKPPENVGAAQNAESTQTSRMRRTHVFWWFFAHFSIRIESIFLAKVAQPATHGEPVERFGRVGWDFLGFLSAPESPQEHSQEPPTRSLGRSWQLLGVLLGALWGFLGSLGRLYLKRRVRYSLPRAFWGLSGALLGALGSAPGGRFFILFRFALKRYFSRHLA